MVALTPQGYPQHHVGSRQLRIQANRSPKLRRCSIQLSELAFNFPQIEMHFLRRLEGTARLSSRSAAEKSFWSE